MGTATVTAIATWKDQKLKVTPCILVTEKLTVDRGVSYHRTDLDEKPGGDGSHVAVWETERRHKNFAEAKAADQVYTNARFRIRKCCLYTEIGYICPASKEDELKKAIEEARDMVDAFNAGAKFCSITFRVLCTRVEPDNADASMLLKESLSKHVSEIKTALQEFDYKKARNLLTSTKPAVDILRGQAREELEGIREDARLLAQEISDVVKMYENHIENALVSPQGTKVIKKAAKRKWDF